MSFLLFFLLGSSLAMRDEICKDQRNVRTVVGEEINLVSPVEKSVQTVEGKDINPVNKAAEARIQSLSFSNFVSSEIKIDKDNNKGKKTGLSFAFFGHWNGKIFQQMAFSPFLLTAKTNWRDAVNYINF